MADDSVTAWLVSLREGDHDAAQKLWRRYIEDLLRLARARLRGAGRAVADEEDAALDALDSFFRGARLGRYPRLDDRDDLWRLLVVITERKAIDLAHRQRRKKRGGGRRIGSLGARIGDRHMGDACDVPAPRASPEVAASLADECRRLMARLGDDTLRQVAHLKMEGYTHPEIADRLGCSERSVARKVELIRAAWRDGDGDEP